jgi:uncharacterized protein (TIGR02421 family)
MISKTELLTDEMIEQICLRLAKGERVRRNLPDGGRLHIDRRLPFLCVYRKQNDELDRGTEDLIKGEASYIVVPSSRKHQSKIAKLLFAIIKELSAQFSGFLIIEIWSAPDHEVAIAADKDDITQTELQPNFTISAKQPAIPYRTLSILENHLKRIKIEKQNASVETSSKPAHPPRFSYLLKPSQFRELQCDVLGICVRPIYRDHDSGELFPQVLHDLKRGIGRALKQAFFIFSKTRTNSRPRHFFSLGRRALVKAVWDVDKRLCEIGDCFDFLLQVTPVNAEASWREFKTSKFTKTPKFYYRPLAVEPAILKRRLFEVKLENIEDPTLAELFQERQDELDRKITMLKDIGSKNFLLGSLQVYGDVEPALLEIAQSILSELPARSRQDTLQGNLSANEFAEIAKKEIAYYQERLPNFSAQVEVRDDIFSGLLCSGGNLLIGHQAEIPLNRVQALLHHEVGTHLVTYYNGLNEPFQHLHSGFAGYDELQEGIAVFSEYIVGGLSIPRLRVLAARVIAIEMMINGASFRDTFLKLNHQHQFSQKVAYTITMRVYRGGGLTKDAVYLRGLIDLLSYLKDGGELEPLMIGKIALDHVPLIQELRHRNVLKPPVLLPRYFTLPPFDDRLTQVRNGFTVLDLAKGI